MRTCSRFSRGRATSDLVGLLLVVFYLLILFLLLVVLIHLATVLKVSSPLPTYDISRVHLSRSEILSVTSCTTVLFSLSHRVRILVVFSRARSTLKNSSSRLPLGSIHVSIHESLRPSLLSQTLYLGQRSSSIRDPTASTNLEDLAFSTSMDAETFPDKEIQSTIKPSILGRRISLTSTR